MYYRRPVPYPLVFMPTPRRTPGVVVTWRGGLTSASKSFFPKVTRLPVIPRKNYILENAGRNIEQLIRELGTDVSDALHRTYSPRASVALISDNYAAGENDYIILANGGVTTDIEITLPAQIVTGNAAVGGQQVLIVRNLSNARPVGVNARPQELVENAARYVVPVGGSALFVADGFRSWWIIG